MAEIDDGGAAFPRSGLFVGESFAGSPPQEGMTLRDAFAIGALPGIVENWPHDDDIIARKAYRIADAMIEERKRRR